MKKNNLTDGIRRLTTLSKLLKKVHPDNFDFSDWAYFNDSNQIAISPKKLMKELQSQTPGTTACAVGFAALHKPFRDEGFKLKNKKDKYSTVIFKQSTKKYKNWDAVCRFFQIDTDTANHLFFTEGYGNDYSLSEVIKNINKQVKRMKKS